MSKSTSRLTCAPVRMSVFSTPAHVAVVRVAVERYCALLGFSKRSAGEVALSVDEALTNVIKHAYHGKEDMPIEVVMESAIIDQKDALKIEIRDWGTAVEPDKIKSRDLNEIRPGGLGVHIMKQCMDSVDYIPLPQRGTKLVMIKYCNP